MTDKIITHPQNDKYDKGWERIWGKKKKKRTKPKKHSKKI